MDTIKEIKVNEDKNRIKIKFYKRIYGNGVVWKPSREDLRSFNLKEYDVLELILIKGVKSN